MADSFKPRRLPPELKEIAGEIQEMLGIDDEDEDAPFLTDDMTPEEEEFELVSYLLKKGYSYEEALEEAREALRIAKEMFGE